MASKNNSHGSEWPRISVGLLAVLAITTSGAEASADDLERAAAPRGDTANWIGIEFGYGMSADDANLFEEGLGRSIVLSYSHWELRFYETYDLEDQSGLYDSENSEGRMAITSLARRIGLVRLGPVGLSGLVGASWVSRPSVRYDPDSIVGGSDFAAMGQHGFGAVAGVGASIALGGHAFLALDWRAHPLVWLDMHGQRVLWDGEQTSTQTIDEQPGGIPTSANVSVGFGF